MTYFIKRLMAAGVAVACWAIGLLFLAFVTTLTARSEPYKEAALHIENSGGGERTTGSSGTISIAKRYLHKNPTGMRYLWCMKFVNMVEQKAGRRGTGSNHTSSVFAYGSRVSRKSARAGDIVYRKRRGGGHVEFFVGWANSSKTAYRAITGNSCGKRGHRYVCEVTRSISKMQVVVRPK